MTLRPQVGIAFALLQPSDFHARGHVRYLGDETDLRELAVTKRDLADVELHATRLELFDRDVIRIPWIMQNSRGAAILSVLPELSARFFGQNAAFAIAPAPRKSMNCGYGSLSSLMIFRKPSSVVPSSKRGLRLRFCAILETRR